MLSIVLGTRPEIIKMSPIIRACQEGKIEFSLLHTGQHYSYGMDRIFFEELGLFQPDYHLDVGSGTHAEQTGRIMAGTEKVFLEDPPDIVLVQGDTNTVLAGALAAAKLHINVGHIEAGLRSFDRRMPEEINRVVADHVSDYLFAPTESAKHNLQKEGIDEKTIFITGNTVVDAVYQNREIAKKNSSILSRLGIQAGDYFLVTAHRTENVDEKSRLHGILSALTRLHEIYHLPVIFPLHPRTQKMMKEFGLDARGITITQPIGYLDFLELEANARLILTDSGGLQEEGCILNVPCVTLRENTERPETIGVGANVLAGTDPETIVTAAERMMASDRTWENPYGDGNAGERIVKICTG
jgi:UDP-N-acetylglucosamine 2-epimerase (non-hydrolysing)